MEAAIVLGVVGLVIGGIWTAASAVRDKNLLRQEQQGMLITNNNIRSIFKGHDLSGAIPLENLSGQLTIFSGVDGFSRSSTNNRIRSPRGDDWGLRILGNTIHWSFFSSNISACINLISSLSASGNPELSSIGFNGGFITNFPFMPNASQCAVGSIVTIIFKI